jgi:hypothetical protein
MGTMVVEKGGDPKPERIIGYPKLRIIKRET